MQSKILGNTKSLSNNRLYKVRLNTNKTWFNRYMATTIRFWRPSLHLLKQTDPWSEHKTTFIQLKSLIKISKFKILQVHLGLRKTSTKFKIFTSPEKLRRIPKKFQNFLKSKKSLFISLYYKNIEQKNLKKEDGQQVPFS